VLGVVSDGNRWSLMGLNKVKEPHTIAEWAFLTDDPQLIAQRLWLLAKPALAQPTTPLVEFLARRALAEVLKEKTRLLTRKVNERLPDGAVSEELIGRWLRDAFSDAAVPPRLVPADPSSPPGPELPQLPPPIVTDVTLAEIIRAGVLVPPVKLFRLYKGKRLEATLLAGGTIEFQGRHYDTCSAAAEAARATVSGRQMSTNGWTFWRYQGAGGKKLTLHDARHQIVAPPREDPSGQNGPQGRPQRYDLRKKFWEGLLGRPKAKATRHADLSPSEFGWIAAGTGVRGLPLVYVIGQDEGRVELYIDRGAGKAAENKRLFDRLHSEKNEIEKTFGGELSWQRLDEKRACRIAHSLMVGGYKSDESGWPEIQDAMIDAMIRLENALGPQLKRLATELSLEGA
jgi:hypothetical protein